jgi:hypothetical protein
MSWAFDTGKPDTLSFANVGAGSNQGWQVWNPAYQFKSAKGVLYYGDTAEKDFDYGSSSNSGVATLALGQLAPIGKRFLKVSMYVDVEQWSNYDKLEIRAVAAGKADVTLWKKAAPFLAVTETSAQYGPKIALPNTWFDINVEIPPALGATGVSLKFLFDSIDGTNNKGLGVFIDDVQIVTQCP